MCPADSLPAVLPLEGVVRSYAWGSPTAIPQLLGVESSGAPVAELWLGAHPDDPSAVTGHGMNLDALIAAHPKPLLGEHVAARFENRLPFLLKLLAAGTALSIQVHPTRAQARAGFADEQARGIPQASPERNYRDPNHKPELLCALSPFDALCGFRPIADTFRLFDALAVDDLEPYRSLLAGPDGLRAAFTALLRIDDPRRLVDVVAARAAVLSTSEQWSGVARAVALTSGDFPGDVGVLVALLLNYVRLEPGQAIYLGAGNVHAYLRGLGVEIMANSDNVLRCGLTSKHIDIDELVKITRFDPLPEPRCATRPAGSAGYAFDIPVSDFGLTVLELIAPAADGIDVRASGPQILLCTEGQICISAEGTGQAAKGIGEAAKGTGEAAEGTGEAGRASVSLGAGQAAFVRPGTGSVLVSGGGRLFRATVGDEI